MVKISSLNDSFHKLALCEYDARKEYQQKGFDGMSEVSLKPKELKYFPQCICIIECLLSLNLKGRH